MIAEGFYDEPMLYDVLHGKGTAGEVRGLRHLADRLGLDPAGPWLEPACGSGRYVRAAVAQGVRISAFDLSEAMIEYARSRMHDGDADKFRLAVADMRTFVASDFAPGWTFELAFNPINTIRHLETDADLLAHLERIHDALRPGGVYAVGMSLSVYGFEQPSEDTWAGTRGSLKVTQVVQYTPAPGGRDRMEQVHNVLAVTRPSGNQIIPSAYGLRSYDREQWEAVLAQSPFSIRGCVDEAGEDIVPTSPGYALWVLQRDR